MRGIFDLLRKHPLAGAAEDDLGDGIRGFAYRSHRVYYPAEGDAVVIVRILHRARDAAQDIGRHR